MATFTITLKAENGEQDQMEAMPGYTCPDDVKDYAALCFGEGVKFTASAPAIGMYNHMTSEHSK